MPLHLACSISHDGSNKMKKDKTYLDVAHGRIVGPRPKTNWRREWRDTAEVLAWIIGAIIIGSIILT